MAAPAKMALKPFLETPLVGAGRSLLAASVDSEPAVTVAKGASSTAVASAKAGAWVLADVSGSSSSEAGFKTLYRISKQNKG